MYSRPIFYREGGELYLRKSPKEKRYNFGALKNVR